MPGIDGVGKVVAFGPETESPAGIPVGTRVTYASWPFAQGGTFQQYVTIPVDDLIKVPDGLSDIAASQFFCNPQTALAMVEFAKKNGLGKGGWLYTDAGNSVVARGIIELSKIFGDFKTVLVVRKASYVDELKALGATAVIDSSSVESVPEAVLEATGGEHVSFAYTAIAGPAATDAGMVVKDAGIVGAYSMMSGIEPVLRSEDAARGVTLYRFNVLNYRASLSIDERKEFEQHVLSIMERGLLTAQNTKVVKLEEAQAALDAVYQPQRGVKWFLEG